MKRSTGVLIAVLALAAVAGASAQSLSADEQQALRARIERRYDVVPLTDGVALRPKSRAGEVRLIEVSDTIAVNGVAVTGRELRDRVGGDADAILRLSYMEPDARRALFRAAPEGAPRAEAEPGSEPERASGSDTVVPRPRRSSGDRIRVFGDVRVAEGEEVSGQVVAVFGTARIDGRVDDQVVAVLGSVELGPHADVGGDVVAVGGHLRRAPGARVGGAVTEVSPGDAGVRLHMRPWFGRWAPMGGDGLAPLALIFGSTFRFVLLALVACAALVLARASVERSAQRVAENPIQTTLVGLAAWVLFAPVLLLTTIVLTISIVGIPLLLLLPFAVLVLLLMALVGFSGTACAVGQWTRRRFGLGLAPAVVDVCLGVFVILLPVLLGNALSFASWAFEPFVFLLLAGGLAVEFLAWSSGMGAVLTNAFTRWGARSGH